MLYFCRRVREGDMSWKILLENPSALFECVFHPYPTIPLTPVLFSFLFFSFLFFSFLFFSFFLFFSLLSFVFFAFFFWFGLLFCLCFRLFSV